MVNGRVPTEHVEGLVESVNATGLKIGGAWVNVSRYHPVQLPDAGAHVRMKVDSKGYIQEIENLTPGQALSDKDARIARLAVLKGRGRVRRPLGPDPARDQVGPCPGDR
jgi:hypothetical protein